MPLARFICPDSVEIKVSDCLAHCRMVHRCLTKPTLQAIVSGTREWHGKPSVTQLLGGTMLAYLRITSDFSLDPRSMAFSLLGTLHHQKLEEQIGGWSSEVRLGVESNSSISGITDLLIADENRPGYHILVDYKTYGSYRVTRLLGIKKHFERSKTETYRRSGKWGKVGEGKWVPVFERSASPDITQEQLQLNYYRILASREGFKISKLELQVTVRDGGTQAATGRGVTENMYYPIDIPFLDDIAVHVYFELRAARLKLHLDTMTMPEPCNSEENWDLRRCKSYCEVARFCPLGSKVIGSTLEEEEDAPNGESVEGGV